MTESLPSSLSEVVAIDRSSKVPGSTRSYSKIFGDRYLLTENTIYRNVRTRVLKYGFRFTDRNLFDYRTRPLLCLTDMMQARTLIYLDNGRAIEKMIQNRTALSLRILDGFSDNYLVHESAHGIAYHHLPGLYRKRRQWAPLDIYKLAFSESFAMATESLAQAEASNSLHILFLRKNSYSAFEPRRIELLQKSLLTFGTETTFQALMVGYVYSNFLFSEVPKESLQSVMRFLTHSRLSAKSLDLLREVAELGQTIGLGFRIGTAELFLETLGVKESPTDFFNFNPERFLTSPRTALWLQHLHADLFKDERPTKAPQPVSK